MTAPEPRRRFFFVHIEKAAGTELREKLKRQFTPRSLYPNRTDGDLIADAPQVSVRQLLERWQARRDEIELITGHFPLATVALLDAEFVTFSVLREPVERVLSHLRHYRRISPEARGRSLESIYADGAPHTFYNNHMLKMFSMTAEEVKASAERNRWAMLVHVPPSEERLARAKSQLARLDVLGLQQHFEEFNRELEARFGWELGAPLHANRTEPEEVPRALREQIAADNAFDVELFAHACEIYATRHRCGR